MLVFPNHKDFSIVTREQKEKRNITTYTILLYQYLSLPNFP